MFLETNGCDGGGNLLIESKDGVLGLNPDLMETYCFQIRFNMIREAMLRVSEDILYRDSEGLDYSLQLNLYIVLDGRLGQLQLEQKKLSRSL